MRPKRSRQASTSALTGRLRHVGGLDLGDAAFVLDQLAGGLRGLEVQVAAVDAGALAGQQDGDRLAVAPARADRAATGDQGHFPVQSEHVSSLSFRLIRVGPSYRAMLLSELERGQVLHK